MDFQIGKLNQFLLFYVISKQEIAALVVDRKEIVIVKNEVYKLYPELKVSVLFCLLIIKAV
jgi:hypothetical protein